MVGGLQKRYLFTNEPDAERADHVRLVRRYDRVRGGVRAVMELRDERKQFTHLYFLEAPLAGGIERQTSRLTATTEAAEPPAPPVPLDLCTAPSMACVLLGRVFAGTPAILPPLDHMVMLRIELSVTERWRLPRLSSYCAGAPIDGGRGALVELSSRDAGALEADIEAWRVHKGVTSVRVMRTDADHMVRAAHL